MTESNAWSKSNYNRFCEMYCQFCNKLCKNLNSLKQHECRCSNNPDRKNANSFSNYISENIKGKTKYNCPAIAKQVETMRQKYENGYQSPMKGRPSTFLGKHHTEESKAKMAVKARYNAINRINGWKSGDSHVQNKYEKAVSSFLTSHNISFIPEATIPQSRFGKKGSYYQFDFLIDNRIDLEIDGTSHNIAHDNERDSYVSKLYIVYRIKHNDSLDEVLSKLEDFYVYYKNN